MHIIRLGKAFCHFLVICALLLSTVSKAISFEYSPHVLRIGFVDVKNYFSYEQNGYEGMVYELLEALKVYTNRDFVYQACSLPDCIEMLDDGRIDAIANVPALVSFESSPNFVFTKEPLASTTLYLYAREWTAKTRKIRIGYSTHMLDFTDLTSHLDRNGLVYGKDYELIPFDNQADAVAAYSEFAIDGIIESTAAAKVDGRQLFQLKVIKTYMAFRPDNIALKIDLDHAMEDMLLARRDIRESMYYFYMGEHEPLLLTPSEKKYLQEHKTLSALVSDEKTFYSFFKDGVHGGAISNILKLIENDLNINIEVTPSTLTQTEKLELLQSGKYDLLADFKYDANWAFDKQALVSFPYLHINCVSVQRKNHNVGLTPSVAVIAGDRYAMQRIRKILPRVTFVFLNNVSECLQAVESGSVDLTFVKAATLKQTLDNLELYDLEINANYYYDQPLCFAISQRLDRPLVQILNKEIAHLDPRAILSNLTNSSLQYKQRRSLRALLHDYPEQASTTIFVGALTIILVLMLVLFINHNASRKIWNTAYLDPDSHIYNLKYFEESLSRYLKSMQSRLRADGQLFVMVIKINSLDELCAIYTRQYVQQQIFNLYRSTIKRSGWIRRYGVSNNNSYLYMSGYVPTNVDFEQLGIMFLNNFEHSTELRLNPILGICIIKKGDNLDPRTLIDKASLALNVAKLSSPAIGFYNDSVRDNIMHVTAIEQHMTTALQQGEFKLWLQPKYNIQTRRVIAAEALVRWDSKELGFTNPGEFIEIFENNGFVLKVDDYILEQAFLLQLARHDEHKPIIPISVNQSGLHMDDDAYLENMRRIANTYEKVFGTIELEITETALVDYETKTAKDHVMDVVKGLKEQGFKLSMDDFGTGYSSIAMLQTFPIDELKVDRALLLEAEKSERAKKILRSVISLGKGLNMRVVTEGIETQAQEAMLTEMGCTYGQGFLFSKPMPAELFYAFCDKVNSGAQ
ncbi:MAG: EAL domain-containing protein [Succinivibrio sp.]|nr:EAL domain-containing protein [Succinivibrio sp.]